MAMGRQTDRQGDLMVTWTDFPRSPGHVFYDRLQQVLLDGGFDGFVEATCKPYYAETMGAKSVPLGRYFRMHLVGYFEGVDSERGLEWRCSDSLSLRDFQRVEMGQRVPDHSWLSKTRGRLPFEVHSDVFGWVLALPAEAGLVKGERIGVDASTHLAYKPEHAVDLDTGAVVAAALHPADEGDTTTLSKTLAATKENLDAVDAAPTPDDPAECVADKGYHSRAVLKDLDAGPWKTRISAPKQKGFSRWHGDDAARRAVTNNRARLLSGVARQAFKLRAEIVERSFAHILDRGGMRRTWLRGRENVHKRYLLHVAGHNLSLLMRQIIGAGTPKEAMAAGYGAILVLLKLQRTLLVTILAPKSGLVGIVAISSPVFPDGH
jgi:hypothetical protein